MNAEQIAEHKAVCQTCQTSYSWTLCLTLQHEQEREKMIQENDAPYCCGDDATLPDGVEITRTHFTGQPLAVCYRCDDFRCAYWECPCELVHECTTDDEGADE